MEDIIPDDQSGYREEVPSRGIIPILLGTAVIVAILAGGAVYAYQKKEADKQRDSLQSQVDDLKNQLHDAKAVTASPSPAASSSAQSPSPTQESGTVDWKQYTNTKFSIKVRYPQDWKIESDTIDKYASAQEGLSEGGSHFAIYPPERSDQSGKLEFFLGATDKSLDEALKATASAKELERKTYNGITWSIGEIVDDGNTFATAIGSFQAIAVIPRQYPGVEEKNVQVSVGGYNLMSQKNTLLTILSTFTIQ